MRIRAGKVAVLAAALMALPGVTPAAQATSPGQNGLLAFDPGGYTIATLDPSGNGVADYLTTGARDGDAAWTANGNRIFFARTLFSGGSEIVSVHVADKRLREYPPISFSEVYAQPWPLPGGGFVFARGPQFGTRHLFKRVMGKVTQLTFSTHSDYFPVPSPDGSRIAFLRLGTGVMVMNANGSQKKVVIPGARYAGIDWSPDGSMVAGAIPDPNGDPTVVVVLAEVSTGEQTVLPGTESGEAGMGSVSFSPDGTKLLVVQDSGGGDSLWTYSLQGTDAQRIPYLPQDDATSYFGRAEWQPIP